MIPVILESPYAGDVEKNLAYARAAMKDSLARGEAPFASHLLYTQCLDDCKPEERICGVYAGLVYKKLAVKTVVYKDLGISPGMLLGIQYSKDIGQEVEYRSILEKKCKQKGCEEKPIYEYFWPGEGLCYGCQEHALAAFKIAQVMGFNLQLNETNP